MPKTVKYGTWTRGLEASIPEMLELCLGGMKYNGVTIPIDKFGRTMFTVSFIQKQPDLYGDSVDEREGFTAIKISYEVDGDEEDKESGSQV